MRDAESSAADADEIVNVVDGIDTSPNGVADVAPSRFAAKSGACESRTEGLESNSVCFLHANVQDFVSKSADLYLFVDQQGFPEIVGFTETFLDKSKSAELHGYIQVARLNRRTGTRRRHYLVC